MISLKNKYLFRWGLAYVKQTGSCKNYLPWRKWPKFYQVYPVPLSFIDEMMRMHQSFVVPAPRDRGIAGRLLFFFFQFLSPAKRPVLRGQIYGKIPAKIPSTLGPGLVSLLQKSTRMFFMVKGLVYSIQLNSKVKYL